MTFKGKASNLTLASGFLRIFLLCQIAWMPCGWSQDNSGIVYQIGGKPVTFNQAKVQDLGAFYNIEKKFFDLISQRAQLDYLEYFWRQQAKATGKTPAEAQLAYEAKMIKISDAEVQNGFAIFQGQPSFAKLSKSEQETKVRDYLYENLRQALMVDIIQKGAQSGELVLLYPEPIEPIYDLKVSERDQVRYGPEATDTKPVGCKGDKCPITIVEYSDFQCGFCARAIPDVKKILAEYKGRIRWVVRDFPIKFHDRAKPAAIAAHCAGEQGKYWEMYGQLFANYRLLEDEDLTNHAAKVGLDASRFAACVKSPKKALAAMDANFTSGTQLGVTGTPAYFINGRRAAGAIPYAEFKRVIDSSLAPKAP